jgi:hypothetical protein
MSEGRGLYKAISLDSAVSSAKDMLGIEDTSLHDTVLKKYGDEAIRRIFGQKALVKTTKCFDIENGRIPLPDGFQRLIAVQLDNSAVDNRAFYVDSDFIEGLACLSDDTMNIKPLRNNVEIVNEHLVFSTNIPAESATITYRGYNIGDDCLMAMYDHQEAAVVAYMCWRFTQKHFVQYPRDIREAYKNEYISQKHFVRGHEFVSQFEQQKAEIGAIFTALLIDRNQDV